MICGDFDDYLIRINGILDINDEYGFPAEDGSAGQMLTTNGNDTSYAEMCEQTGASAYAWVAIQMNSR